MNNQPSRPDRRWTTGGAFTVAAVTLIAFLPVLSAGFVTWDDDSNFLNNANYRGLGPSQLHWMWTTFHLGHYVPLSWMTLGVDYTIWGMNPFGYHLTNLILHVANALVLYYVVRRLLRHSGVPGEGEDPEERRIAIVATFATLVFAVHPLRVESVAWITERRDVLSGLLSSLTLLAYLKSIDAGTRRRLWYWCAVTLFAAALLSKATVVTLPVVIAIVNVYPLKRLGGSSGWHGPLVARVYRELIPFVALAAGASIMAFLALQRVDQLPPSEKVAVSAYSLAFYLLKTILPTGLAPLYKMPSRIDPTGAVFAASYLIAIALTAVAWIMRKRWSASWLGWVALVVILLPMLGVHQNGPQIAADRYTYHASPVVGILAASALASLLDSAGAGFLVLSSVIVLTLGALTWRQSEIWHDSERMWSRVIEVDSTSSIAQTALANVLLKRNDLQGAIAHYQQSLAINPASPEAHDNLGVAFAREGNFPEAIEQYRQTLRFRPSDYEAENDLGAALAHTGNDAEAIDHYQRALTIKPDFADAHVNWGNALVRLNNPDEAVTHYREATRIRPDDADAERNWGVALAQHGRLAESIEHFRRAVEINPADSDAKAFLGRATAQLLAPSRQP